MCIHVTKSSYDEGAGSSSGDENIMYMVSEKLQHCANTNVLTCL